MTKILGIDEAGRGAVLSNLVICGALISEKKLSELTKLKVKDSKLLTPLQRETLEPKIKSVLNSFEIVKITPSEIDEKRETISLNDIEAMDMCNIINKLKPDAVYIDAIDSSIKTFKTRLNKYLKFTPGKMVLEHKADVTYPICSAASILAKVERDRDISKLSETYGEIGSGYPSDPVTVSFLKSWIKEHKTLPPIVRESWSTAEELKSKKKQKSLSDFE